MTAVASQSPAPSAYTPARPPAFRLPDFSTPHARYWPCEVLMDFTLQMAAKGQCINSSMMLGSREYAIEKLNHARSLGDERLRQLAVCMFSYFDDEPCHAVAALVGSAMHH